MVNQNIRRDGLDDEWGEVLEMEHLPKRSGPLGLGYSPLHPLFHIIPS